MKLGIVGHGFVGSAVNQGFTKNIKKYIVDEDPNIGEEEQIFQEKKKQFEDPY